MCRTKTAPKSWNVKTVIQRIRPRLKSQGNGSHKGQAGRIVQKIGPDSAGQIEVNLRLFAELQTGKDQPIVPLDAPRKASLAPSCTTKILYHPNFACGVCGLSMSGVKKRCRPRPARLAQ